MHLNATNRLTEQNISDDASVAFYYERQILDGVPDGGFTTFEKSDLNVWSSRLPATLEGISSKSAIMYYGARVTVWNKHILIIADGYSSWYIESNSGRYGSKYSCRPRLTPLSEIHVLGHIAFFRTWLER